MQEKGQGRETLNKESSNVPLKKYVIKWKFATLIGGYQKKQQTVNAANELGAIKQLNPFDSQRDRIISIDVFNLKDIIPIRNLKDEATELLNALDNTKNIEETYKATVNLVDFVKRIAGID